ncbi:MAG: c-type cytochrome [Blastocatellia bacterium]
MRTNRNAKAAVTVLGLISFAVLPVMGTGFPDREGNQSKRVSVLDRAPASAASLENPYKGQADAVLAGRKLFRRHCADCHGLDAGGGKRAPDLRSVRVRDAAPGILFWFLRNGSLKRGMPSWSGLPEQQRWQIVSYLKSLKAAKENPK